MSYPQPTTAKRLRGVFPAEEAPEWDAATRGFPNRVPRFASKDAAIAFTKAHCTKQSHPDDPTLRHSITTLTEWAQIERYLLPKIAEYQAKWCPILPDDVMGEVGMEGRSGAAQNRYMNPHAAVYAEAAAAAQSAGAGDAMDVERAGSNSNDGDGDGDGDGDEAMAVHDPLNGARVHRFLLSRLNLPIHRVMPPQATLNTLKYLFYHMKCGIYVMIRNNAVAIFCPFVNKHYTNNWGDALAVDSPDGSLRAYYAAKQEHYREEEIIEKSQWWANGNIICNEHEGKGKAGGDPAAAKPNQWQGDHFLFQLKDMLSEACRCRAMPDCDLFLNKRDYPQLKYHPHPPPPLPQPLRPAHGGAVAGAGAGAGPAGGMPVEPYGFIYDRDDRDPAQDLPLSRHAYKSYAPILSFYTSERFADVPFPPSEDWEAATGEVFPSTFNYDVVDGQIDLGSGPRDLFTADNLRKFEVPWDSKVPTAFFRGTATGGGVTVATNQRLALAQLCHDWSNDGSGNSSSGSGSSGDGDAVHPHLDAKIVGWNMRDKKIAGGKMTFIRKKDFPFTGDRATNFVPIYQQGTYKYLLYVEGHCAACRYGFMMQLGSVILKVESRCVADQMWYFPLLVPYRDHVPVKADLSDLREKIDWCRAHDSECQQIASNARALHRLFVSRDGVLDYLQAICVETARRTVLPPDWAAASGAPPRPAPQVEGWRHMNMRCAGTAFCDTCARLRQQEAADAQRHAAAAAAGGGGGVTAKEDALKELRRKKKLESIEAERRKRLGRTEEPGAVIAAGGAGDSGKAEAGEAAAATAANPVVASVIDRDSNAI